VSTSRSTAGDGLRLHRGDSILRNLRVDAVLFAGVNADHRRRRHYLAGLLHGGDGYNVRQCFGFTRSAAELGALPGT